MYFVKKKYCLHCKTWKTQSKIKSIKAGKDLGTTHCLGCKDFTHNFSLQEVKMTNKVLIEKNQTVLSVDLVNQDF